MRAWGARRAAGPIMRAQRIGREERENVGEHQFLMLLLMSLAERKKRRDRGRFRLAAGEQFAQRVVHIAAVGEDFVRRGARQEPAPGPRMPGPGGFIIGVEAIREALVEDAIAAHVRRQDERFEEPARMRQMPFRGAGVVHRLDGHVLGRQRFGDVERELAGREE